MPDENLFDPEKHVEYIINLQKGEKVGPLFYADHKRLSGVYWGVSSLQLLNRLDDLPKDKILQYVLSCYHSLEGAFSGNTDQDPHLLYTLSGLQILAIYDELDKINKDDVVRNIQGLQQADGSFAGDMWGEVDTRFSYCAILTLSILNRLDAIDLNKAINYIVSCQNFDGGFGCIPGAESHAGQIFCCVGMLSLTKSLDLIDKETLGVYLCERQLPSGGLNGRPDKLEDVCYSWWVLASLCILGYKDWIDGAKLKQFILRCQDPDEGGFADRPGDMPDVFHTFFGLGGLSLLGEPHFPRINPSFALLEDVVNRLNNGPEESSTIA